MLALEHKLVATRGEFLDVYAAMELIDPNSAAPGGGGENNGPTACRVLLEGMAQLEACIGTDGSCNEFTATEVIRRSGGLARFPVDARQRDVRRDEVRAALAEFARACRDQNSAVGTVIGPLLAAQLFDVDRRLLEAYDDKSPAPPPRVRGEDETAAARARRGWCALFGAPWKELARYRRYLAGQSELATHQVVKGSEFENVMVVMDDAQAGGFLISYDKLFGGKELSPTDRSRQGAGDETTIDRSLRLLYVTCSRARESLALVLWSANPDAAVARLHQYRWFDEGEILRIP